MKDKNKPVIEQQEGFTLRRREFLALLSGTAAVAAMAGSSSLLAKVNTNGGLLRIGAPANPSSLDPATGGAGSDHIFLFPIFSTLVEWDYSTLAAKPGLAASWEFPDPKTMVMNLRQGVTFHDGAPFDAEAVRFNFERNKTAPAPTSRPTLGLSTG